MHPERPNGPIGEVATDAVPPGGDLRYFDSRVGIVGIRDVRDGAVLFSWFRRIDRRVAAPVRTAYN